jgi:hypothetical protein
MVTHDTTEFGLALAVTTFRMSTRTTALAGVCRIAQLDPHTGQLRLVADKRSQLTEGPIAVSRSLPWPANPYPRSDAAQIFKRNHPLRAFGFGKKPLADGVIGIFLKAPLATLEVVQAALGRFGSDLLQCLTAPLVPLTAAFDLLTAEHFAITILKVAVSWETFDETNVLSKAPSIKIL